jgi:translocator protein
MKVLKFIFSLLLSFAPGIAGMHWTPSGNENAWYNTLVHPAFTPASWVFPVVWTTLYFLLGTAFYQIIKHPHKSTDKLVGIELFIVHVILNGAWSYVFFGQHLVELGAVIIIALIITAFMMSQVFAKINLRASKLVTPYIIWLFCALYLNTGIYLLN